MVTQQPSTQVARYLEAFEAFQKNGAYSDPSWVSGLRNAAIAVFKDLGFPTTRRGNEEWKYTDIGPLARRPFHHLTTPSAHARLDAEALEPYTLGEYGWHRLVFVDGSYVEQLSYLSSMPAGVTVTNLAEAMTTQADLTREHLAHHATYEANAFIALNTAFVHDGAFIHIPDRTVVEEPILLLFLYTSHAQDTVSHPRVLILAGEDSQASFIESYAGLFDGHYLTNAVTEVVAGAESSLNYYKLQQQSEQVFHITNTRVALSRNSSFSSVNIDLGGGLVRNNLDMLMGEEGGSCRLNGLYMVTGTQHVDNQVIVDHAKPYTTSRELYKGILDGKSRSVFHGSIIVREGAKKVDAHQEDKNLLLSDQAEADTKPAFWIYCDDVKCGHGASSGQIDEAALHYLRSRGIGEQAARSLLIRGFVTGIIDSIDCEPLRTHVDALVQSKLQDWLGNGNSN